MNTLLSAPAVALDDMIRQIVRQLLREIAAPPADGQPRAAQAQLSDPALYVRLSHRQLQPGDPLLANSPVIGVDRTAGGEPDTDKHPVESKHHLYESFIYDIQAPSGADTSSASARAARDIVETTLASVLNPIYTYTYGDSAGWLLTDTYYEMILALLALRADEETDYAAKAFSNPSWPATNRGVHEVMATLVRLATRHPAFISEDLLYRRPGSFLFFTTRQFVASIRRFGVALDVQTIPSRGIFVADVEAYADCRTLLTPGQQQNIVAVEFSYEGAVRRGVSPLNIPIYRVPGPIAPASIHSIIDVATNNDIWVATSQQDVSALSPVISPEADDPGID